MLMEFSAGEFEMGALGSASGEVAGKAVVAAPSPIAYAEVLVLADGATEWKTLARWEHPGRVLDEGYTVSASRPTTIYLRAELEDKVNGRVARGWSSPIWFKP
jgi:hypothetical protein